MKRNNSSNAKKILIQTGEAFGLPGNEATDAEKARAGAIWLGAMGASAAIVTGIGINAANQDTPAPQTNVENQFDDTSVRDQMQMEDRAREYREQNPGEFVEPTDTAPITGNSIDVTPR